MINFPIYEYFWFAIKVIVGTTLVVGMAIHAIKYISYELKGEKKDE